jgi:hypothetical protein
MARLFFRKSVQVGYAAKRSFFIRLGGAIVGCLGLALLLSSFQSARP